MHLPRLRPLAALLSASLILAIAPGPPAVATGGVDQGPARVERAANTVTINYISAKTASYTGTYRLKPKYTKYGRVAVSSATVTVRKGTRTIARNRTAINLRPGTYSITQKVKWRPYSVKQRVATRYPVGYDFGGFEDEYQYVYSCTITSVQALPSENPADATSYDFTASCDVEDADRTWTTPAAGHYDGPSQTTTFDGDHLAELYSEPVVGETLYPEGIRLTEALTATESYRVYGTYRSKSASQKFVVRKPRTCATYTDFKSVWAEWDEPYGDAKSTVARKLNGTGTRTSYSDYGDYVIEFRRYKPCKSGVYISVGFFDGYAYAKTYSD